MNWVRRTRRRRCGFVLKAGSAPAVALKGDPTILDRKLLGFFCSVRCPGDVILKTYDLARALRIAEVTLIGGFQSPMEKEFLALWCCEVRRRSWSVRREGWARCGFRKAGRSR